MVVNPLTLHLNIKLVQLRTAKQMVGLASMGQGEEGATVFSPDVIFMPTSPKRSNQKVGTRGSVPKSRWASLRLFSAKTKYLGSRHESPRS